jgi:hypothetical protein
LFANGAFGGRDEEGGTEDEVRTLEEKRPARAATLVAPRWTRVVLRICAATVSAGAVWAASASAASTTTAPGVLFNFDVTITDTKVLVHAATIRGGHPQKYVRGGGASVFFPRGALIRFICKNRGTNSYLPALRYQGDIVRTAPRVAPPGGRVDLNVSFVVRGAFQLEALLQRKQHGRPVQITVY